MHGFPLDWNHWHDRRVARQDRRDRAATHLPVWVSEVGVSTFGAEEVQEWGLRRTAELLIGRAPRIHWYSLYDLPAAWPATTRHREAEGSSYYRHFHMGLLDEHGTPEAAARIASRTARRISASASGSISRITGWMTRCAGYGTRRQLLRTGLSWADWFRPNADAWFDRQMRALEGFDVTVTFCFTPEHCGTWAHYTAPPQHPEAFAEFCATMLRNYT